MKFLTLLAILISCLSVFGDSDYDPGLSLLGAYSFDSIGGKTRDQLSSLNSLKSVVDKIQEDDHQCRYLADQVRSLPDMDSVINSLRQSTAVEAIKEKEAIINQAIADLQSIEEGSLSEQKK